MTRVIPKILGLTVAAAMMASVSPVQAKDLTIGFITTLTTPAALIGKQMKAGAELAMDHIGHKMGGKNVKILFEDDGFNPKIGKQKTEKLIKKDKVDMMAGYIWSHVLGASAPVVLKANKFLFVSNAGHSIYSGKKCHKIISMFPGKIVRTLRPPVNYSTKRA